MPFYIFKCMTKQQYVNILYNRYSEKLHVMLAGKIPRPKHSPSSEYDFIDSQSMYNSRYIDMGKNIEIVT